MIVRSRVPAPQRLLLVTDTPDHVRLLLPLPELLTQSADDELEVLRAGRAGLVGDRELSEAEALLEDGDLVVVLGASSIPRSRQVFRADESPYGPSRLHVSFAARCIQPRRECRRRAADGVGHITTLPLDLLRDTEHALGELVRRIHAHRGLPSPLTDLRGHWPKATKGPDGNACPAVQQWLDHGPETASPAGRRCREEVAEALWRRAPRRALEAFNRLSEFESGSPLNALWEARLRLWVGQLREARASAREAEAFAVGRGDPAILEAARWMKARVACEAGDARSLLEALTCLKVEATPCRQERLEAARLMVRTGLADAAQAWLEAGFIRDSQTLEGVSEDPLLFPFTAALQCLGMPSVTPPAVVAASSRPPPATPPALPVPTADDHPAKELERPQLLAIELGNLRRRARRLEAGELERKRLRTALAALRSLPSHEPNRAPLRLRTRLWPALRRREDELKRALARRRHLGTEAEAALFQLDGALRQDAATFTREVEALEERLAALYGPGTSIDGGDETFLLETAAKLTTEGLSADDQLLPPPLAALLPVGKPPAGCRPRLFRLVGTGAASRCAVYFTTGDEGAGIAPRRRTEA